MNEVRTQWIHVLIKLTYFKTMLHFYTPLKHQKTRGFLFSGVKEMEHWLKLGNFEI